ncbi:MAG: pilus assembly protein PilP [Bdellovibrionales bacterium]|nr:pilus assembly protein PilP [Bdellovibrionales bacterium]
MKILQFAVAFFFLNAVSAWAALSGPGEPASSTMESLLNEDLIRALRDPFEAPLVIKEVKTRVQSDLELYQLRDLKLNGVITGPKKSRALIASPKGQTFFVKVGDLVGAREGRVTSITPDAVRIVEFYVDDQGKRLPDTYEMRMDGDLKLLDRKGRN